MANSFIGVRDLGQGIPEKAGFREFRTDSVLTVEFLGAEMSRSVRSPRPLYLRVMKKKELADQAFGLRNGIVKRRPEALW
jgi:hypothetical protein